MNELRKWISDELIDHAKNYERAFDSDRVERTQDATDRILAIIAEAMLSEEVVEAGARAITHDPNFGNNTWADDARNVITDALTAAGITGADTTD